MRGTKMLVRALGVEGVVVEDVRWDEDGELVVRVRPRREHRRRCPHCGERCPGYDSGGGRRMWRARDVGLVSAFIEAEAPRVKCASHGVVVAAVPWARRASGFTRSFEDTVAWLAVRTDKTTLAGLLKLAWRTVGAIVERVSSEARRAIDPFENVRRIGIDEISYRKRHRVRSAGSGSSPTRA